MKHTFKSLSSTTENKSISVSGSFHFGADNKHVKTKMLFNYRCIANIILI